MRKLKGVPIYLLHPGIPGTYKVLSGFVTLIVNDARSNLTFDPVVLSVCSSVGTLVQGYLDGKEETQPPDFQLLLLEEYPHP